MKKLLFTGTLLVLFLSPPALASDWGCKVLLCLSNPAGPEAEPKCVPPIQQLWHTLSHGGQFPSCSMGSASSGNYGGNTWASGGYCAPGLVQLDPLDPTNPSLVSCNAQGAINVVVNGSQTTRIWWGVSGQPTTTVNESAAAGNISYDPTQTASNAIAAIQAQQQTTTYGNAP